MLTIALAAAPSLSTSSTPRTVVVAGATGRSGRLVVAELLKTPQTQVRALVRNTSKAYDVLPSHPDLSLLVCDLADTADAVIEEACTGANGLIWCASGFTDQGESIDVKGMREFTKGLQEAGNAEARLVMLSSAGVSRIEWDDTKAAALVGASDIPIIRLNPGNILGKKLEAESLLRASGVPYCVVRPTGLKDDWPAGRPILSQGDVAVGRTTPTDLASVLVQAVSAPHAAGKTFEMFTLAGYPPPSDGLTTALEALAPDAAGPLPEARVEASYKLLQQLLPGEAQDATRLEMGRTYEQVDRGEVSRERGAAPTDRERAMASAALDSITTSTPRKKRFFGLF